MTSIPPLSEQIDFIELSSASRSQEATDLRDDSGPLVSHRPPAQQEGITLQQQVDPKITYLPPSPFLTSDKMSREEPVMTSITTKSIGIESKRTASDAVASGLPASHGSRPDEAANDASAESHRYIQFAMTLLFALLLPAAVLSLWVLHHYRLLVITFWILLWLLFGALMWFVQYITRNPTVLHPALHRLALAVVQEYHHFVADWQREVLLLTNGDSTSDDPTQLDDGLAPTKPRPKSRIFRALVQPFVPFLARRREKKRERSEKRRQKRTAGPAAPPEAYAPPDYQLV